MPENTTTGTASAPARRIPIVDYLVIDEDEPYLRANECGGCAALFFDRRNACASCGGQEFGQRRLATTGWLRTFTVVYRAAPGVPAPYVSAIVALDGGGVVKANLLLDDPDPAGITPGMRVRMRTWTAGTDDDGQEAVAFGFGPF